MNDYAKYGVLALFLASTSLFAANFRIPDQFTYFSAILPVVLFSVSVAFLGLMAVLPIEPYFSIPAIALSGLAFPIFLSFSLPVLLLTLGWLAGCLLFLFEAIMDGRERVKISIGKNIEAGLGTFFIVFFIGAAAYSFLYFQSEHKSPADLIPGQIYDIASGISGQYFAKLGCPLEGTVDSCIDKLTADQVKRNLDAGSSQCAGLDAAARTLCISDIERTVTAQTAGMRQEIRSQLLSQFDPSMSGSQPVGSFLVAGLKLKAAEILKPYEKVVPALMAVLTYSILNLLSFAAAVLIKLLGSAMLSLLLAAKAVEVKTVEVDAESLE